MGQAVGYAFDLRISIVLLVLLIYGLLHLRLHKLTRVLEKVLPAAVHTSTISVSLAVRKVSKAGRRKCLYTGLLLQLLVLLKLGWILTD